MNNSKIYFAHQVYNPLIFKNYLLAELTYLQTRANKTNSFLGNKKANGNSVNEQNTNTHTHTHTHTHTQKNNITEVSKHESR